MTFEHSKVLIKYLFQEDPSRSIFKKIIFKSYLLIYLVTELLFGAILSTKIFKIFRKIKLKTRLNNGYLINHKIEHIPYLYDLQNFDDKIHTNKKKILFDIGAHIGSFALKYTNKNNKIYAFEPNKENYSFLLQNIKDNKLDKRIAAFNFAISNKNGSKNLKLSEGSGGHSFHIKSKKFEKVKTFTIHTFCKTNRIGHIDIIKIDVEGDELNILIGANEIIKKMNPLIIIELHPWYISPKKIIKKLEEFNYRIDTIDGLKIYTVKNTKNF